jgi:hypothetical protein
LVGKPEGKRSLGRTRHGRKNNTGMDLKKTRWEVWIGCTWLRIDGPVAGS